MNILKQTLDNMTDIFSSNEFVKEAARLGFKQRDIDLGKCRNFLIENAEQHGSRRTWRKKNTELFDVENQIQKAIDLLKKHGYKIMKPVNEWQEV